MTDNALFADVAARTLRGLLLPFDELSAPSVSKTDPVMFSKGTVALPEDVSVLNANRLHSQHHPVARFASVEETDAGLVAEFAVARSADGDALLAEASDPDPAKRPRLSAEVRALVRSGARAISATLTGAAFVPQGAFASAALFSIAPDEAEALKEQIGEVIDQATEPAEPETPEAAPASDNEEGEFGMSNATIPAGVTAPAAPAPSADGLFAAIATKDRAALAQYEHVGELFAIDTLQHSGPGGVTIGADTQARGVLGELWDRNPYARKFVPLFDQQSLTSMQAVGWRWTEEPEVDDYAGNTAEVPSNELDTEQVIVNAARLAGGHKLDRRFRDFGDQQVIESYTRKMTESYARKSDGKGLAAAVSGSTPVIVTQYTEAVAPGLNAIVDGALAVIESENTPSFAIVSPELWRAIALTGKDDVFGFLAAGFGLEQGSVEGFKVIPGNVGTGKVLVGAKPALTFFELPGSPIRVEGIDPHHGAIDPAVFGYWAAIVNAPDALAMVDTADYEDSGIEVV